MTKQTALGFSQPNQLYCGDCYSVLDVIPNESVDLIYMDPPFYSQRVYETIWNEESERFAFEDRWAGGINHYVNYLITRIKKMSVKLKGTGSFYIHLDWHISHYMKTELDKIFGYGHFQAEIVWRRTSAHIDTIGFGHITDSIFFYTISNQFTWNPQFRPYTEEHLSKSYRHRDPATGKRFMLADLTGAGIRRWETGKPWQNINPTRWNRHWIRPPKDLQELDRQGLVYWPDRGGMPRLKKFLSERGQPIDNIWTDISPVTSQSSERLGYPTQKPLVLLERIISASSNPGDLVLDAFCGCGTTLAAAQKLSRRWIGIDISQTAIRVVEKRLQKLGAVNYEIHGLISSIAELKALNPFEFQNWAINAVYGQHSPRKIADMGIDGFTFLERHPIQVKQASHVGRPVIDAFVRVLEREKDKKGMIIALGFTTGAVEEAARLERENNIKIQPIKCSDLLAGDISYKVIRSCCIT
ncbi:MAG: restriction endonuclease [Acidobacteria bacterium]|nr:restriction endonuclease [Acidobacteriota bacterium]